jgi:hypothetical protein
MVLDPSSIARQRPTPMIVETPLPPGMEMPGDAALPARQMQPIQNNIRGLLQRLRGKVPNQVAPAPQPPQPEPMRSVLKRP